MDTLSKVALVFPGVGSQHTQMAKSFYDNSVVAKKTFEEASDILNIDMQEICFSSEKKEELNQIDLSQLTLFTASMAIFHVFQQELGIKPAFCLGHSLGEYTALCVSGAYTFSDGLQLIKQRSEIIREALTSCDGTMMWVINLHSSVVEQVCTELSNEREQVYVSAYDNLTQSSISGNTALIRKVAEELERKGAIVYPLRMSGPFHSPLMAPVAEKMKDVFKNYTFQDLRYPVISNHNATLYAGKESIGENLTRQLVSPIRWRESIAFLTEHEVQMAFEIGPKDILKFLIKKNTSSIIPYAFNEYRLIEDIKNKWLISLEEGLAVIGRCLKTAVTTKNCNPNLYDYQTGVVKPYQEVEALYEQLERSGEQPTAEQIKVALKMVDSVLKTKQVPFSLKERVLTQILEGKLLFM